MKTNRYLTFLATSLFATSSYGAITLGDVILLDFGATSETGYAQVEVGDFAGGIDDIGGIADVDLDFTLLNVSVGTEQGTMRNFDHAGNAPTASDFFAWTTAVLSDAVLSDELNQAETLTLTFSGLDDSLTYDVAVAAGRDQAAGNPQNFDSVFTSSASSLTNSPQTGDYTVGWTGLSSTGGVLEIEVAQNNRVVNISALALEAVPEPSSAILVGAGGFLLLLRRNRRF